MTFPISDSRRHFVSTVASAATLLTVGAWSFAQPTYVPTPRQTRGPFYPLELPLDKDNDLVTITGHTASAQGEITHVGGRILDERGRVIPKARVEIWQCDMQGRYHHPWDAGYSARDPHFQGYGQFITGTDGSYRFRTIKPVSYSGRAPHIHFAITAPGAEPFTTQMYIAGAPENNHDFLLNSVPESLRYHLLVDLAPHAAGEWRGLFDIVL